MNENKSVEKERDILIEQVSDYENLINGLYFALDAFIQYNALDVYYRAVNPSDIEQAWDASVDMLGFVREELRKHSRMNKNTL